MAFSPETARRDFPFFQRRGADTPVYLDSAATSQKPAAVIGAVNDFYASRCAPVRRGIYRLSEEAGALYEGARAKVASFVGAAEPGEVVFVRGATEAVNLVASSFGRAKLKTGDEVLVTALEHHSNLLPWQQLCRESGALLRAVPADGEGRLPLPELGRLISSRTRLVAVAHVGNALGSINPVKDICRLAAGAGAASLVDGAQAVGRIPVDVRDLGCDFYAFSGHKMYGPDGVGALYGRKELLTSMPPFQLGGGMVKSVSLREAVFEEPPHRFEAGTQAAAGAVGLAAAIGYLEGLGLAEISAHDRAMGLLLRSRLAGVDGVRLVGNGAGERAGIVSFIIRGMHPHDAAELLDGEGIAVRAGHHCCQPLMESLGLGGTVRASAGLYTTEADVDALAKALAGIIGRWRR